MAVFRSLVAFASIAIFALSSAPVHVNALVADRALVARHIHNHNHNHDGMAKRKRADPSNSGSCVPRPSSAPPSSSATPTPSPSPSTTSAPSPSPSTTSSSAAPASSPSTTTSSAAPTSSSVSTTKKWGLAWPNGDEWLSNFAQLKNVQFIYTWSPEYPDTAKSLGLIPMVMLWGYDQVADFKNKTVPGYANYVLGPNEVNEPNEANMTPGQAVDVWMNDINYLKDYGYRLVSPSCTDDDDGFSWYTEFFSLCKSAGCHIDAIAVHDYTTSADHLIQYCTDLYGNFSLNVLITEFADQNFSGVGGQASMDQVWDFAGKVAHFVDNTPWIEAAFPFGAMQNMQGVNTFNSLMDANGNPTPLATYYFDSDH